MRIEGILKAMIITGLLSGGCGSIERPEIIAHRGASHIAPENTVAAAVKAWELGADAVEVDIYLSSDKRIIVLHDASTKRTTGADYAVAATASDVLRSLDAGSWKAPEYAGEKLPFLEEIIDTVPSGKLLYIEIKCGPEVIPELKKLLEASSKQSRMRIITFDYNTAVECERIITDVPVYWLAGTAKDDNGEFIPHGGDLIEKSKAGGLDGLDLHYGGFSAAFVEKVKREGLGIYAWTVNDPEVFKKLKEWHVDGITTDKPGEMKNLR